MKSSFLILSLIICGFISASSPLVIGTEGAKRYAFNNFDKTVFMNHATSEIELIYPTELIESIKPEMFAIERLQFEMLLYPALSRLVFKRHANLLKSCNSSYNPNHYAEMNPAAQLYWQKNAEYASQLNSMYEKVKGMSALIDGSRDVMLFESDLMLILQLAVYKVKRWEYGEISAVVCEGRHVFANGSLKYILNKYAAYENKENS